MTVIFGCTCTTPKATPDPLAGWRPDFSQQVNPLITNDYQDYIKKLSPKERGFVGSTELFENGSGEHAVRIRVGINGAWWKHVLFYDINNRRVKVVKYKDGGYSS